MRRVMKKVKNPVLEKQPTDVTFTTRVPWNAHTDEELCLRITAINKKIETFTINAVVVAHVVKYNGVKVQQFEKIATIITRCKYFLSILVFHPFKSLKV